MIYPVDSDSTLHYNKDKHIKAGNVLESSESQKNSFQHIEMSNNFSKCVKRIRNNISLPRDTLTTSPSFDQ